MAKSPSRARDDDDEDDRPRRRPADDDDEDERPRSRRSRDEDEEDERPQRRRFRDEDDEDEDEERVTIPAGTPEVYVHKDCKKKTRMPKSEIVKYLENPFELGEEPTTHCSHCDEPVPWHDCYWADTQQNLYEYIDDMRGEMVATDNDPRTPLGPNWILIIVAGALVSGIGGGIGKAIGQSRALMAVVGFVVGALIGVVWMFIDHANSRKAVAEWNRKLVKRYYKRHPEAKQAKKLKRRDDDDEDE